MAGDIDNAALPLSATAATAVTARGWLLILGVTLAAFAEAIASTVLSTGRLDIIGDTHATPDELAWLDVVYTAAKVTAFMIAPWLMSRLSGTVTIRAATGLLTLACGLAAVSDDTNLLVALRILQGAAGGVLLVAAQTALFQMYPKLRQPLLQALFAIGAVVAPAAFIPLTSGWTIDSLSWTWIFFSAFGVGLAALPLVIAAGEIETDVASNPLDWPDLLLAALSALALAYVLNQGSRWNWFDESRIVILTAVGLCALGLFIVAQLSSPRERLLDLTIFHDQGFALAFVVTFVAGFALTGSSYLIPAFAVSVLGMTPTDAGWLLLPSGFVFIAALLSVAALVRWGRVPPIATVPFGIFVFMASMWWLSYVDADSGSEDMLPAILLRGLGLGLLFLSLTLIAINGLPRASLAYGVALFNFGRLAGGQIGIAALQTQIDHQTAQNLTVLAANMTAGRTAIAERLSQAASLLASHGIDPGLSSRAATSILARQVAVQAAVISFDDAFFSIALLFVVAAPVLILYKIVLTRMKRL